ncbi:hypothetical protein GCM10020219_016050 [Nonomuraea dietziae]
MIFSVQSVVKVSPATFGSARPAVVVGGSFTFSKKPATVAVSEVAKEAKSAAASAPSPSTTTITWPHSSARGVSPAFSTGLASGAIFSVSVLSGAWLDTTPRAMIASS